MPIFGFGEEEIDLAVNNEKKRHLCKSPHDKKKAFCNHIWWWMLTRLIVVIVLKLYIYIYIYI